MRCAVHQRSTNQPIRGPPLSCLAPQNAAAEELAGLAGALAAACIDAYARGRLGALGHPGPKGDLPRDWLSQLLLAPLLRAACRCGLDGAGAALPAVAVPQPTCSTLSSSHADTAIAGARLAPAWPTPACWLTACFRSCGAGGAAAPCCMPRSTASSSCSSWEARVRAGSGLPGKDDCSTALQQASRGVGLMVEPGRVGALDPCLPPHAPHACPFRRRAGAVSRRVAAAAAGLLRAAGPAAQGGSAGGHTGALRARHAAQVGPVPA